MANPQPIDWNAGGNVSLQEMLLADKWRGERQGRNRMAPLIEPALRGDTGALAGIFQQSPDAGLRIAHVVGQMDANKRKAMAEYTDFITRDGMGILQAPAADRPALYAQTLAEAQRRGYDVSQMPPQYDAGAESKLKMFVQRALPFATAIKRMGAGAGGPAPAAGGWGGPPAPGGPRVSAAPAPTDGPMVAVADTGGPAVADAGDQPPAAPAVANSPQPAPQSVAGAGPVPMAFPQAQPGSAPAAPQAPAQQFAAPPGPMLAQVAAQPSAPPATPVGAPAPAPTQMAGGATPPDDSGEVEGGFVGGPDAERAFKLNPGESIKLEPKTGKPITDSGGVWVQAKDGSVEWRLLDPQGRPIRVQQVDLGDRVRILGSGGENLGEIKKGRSPNAPSRVQTQDLGDRVVVLGPDGEEVRAYPKGKPPREDKPLDNSARDDLRNAAAPAHAIATLLSGFKPDFAGYRMGFVGDMDNARLRNQPGGDPSGQAQWWQQYNGFANEVRHGLFGASLTKGEKDAFDAAMINPGMDPGEIQKNLQRQRHIFAVALSRAAHGMREGGMSAPAIEAQAGLKFNQMADPFNQPGIEAGNPMSRVGQGAPAATSLPPPTSPPGPGAAGIPKRLRFNPNTQELE